MPAWFKADWFPVPSPENLNLPSNERPPVVGFQASMVIASVPRNAWSLGFFPSQVCSAKRAVLLLTVGKPPPVVVYGSVLEKVQVCPLKFAPFAKGTQSVVLSADPGKSSVNRFVAAVSGDVICCSVYLVDDPSPLEQTA